MHPLKKLMKKHNLKITEFVREYKIGYTTEFISYVIRGERNLRKKSALDISHATGIPVEVLMFPENYN